MAWLGGNLVRYSGITPTRMRVMYLSPANVMKVTADVMASIPLQGAIPVTLVDKSPGVIRGYTISDGRCLLQFKGHFYQLSNYVMLQMVLLLLQSTASLTRDVPSFLLEVLAIDVNVDVTSFITFPNIFTNGTLIRAANDRQVFVVIGYRKCRVMSVNVFYRNAWSFDNVVVVPDDVAHIFFPLLPTGPDLN